MRILALLLALLALACQKAPPASLPAGAELAVARFTNPQNTWELLAGCLPEQCVLLDPKILARMDETLGRLLEARGRTGYVPPQAVRQCEAQVEQRAAQALQAGETQRQAAFRHWLAVGRCVPADYLLVPQLQALRERDIAEERPASVTMDLFLLDVKNQRIVRRFRFEETQQPLMSNLFDVDKFVARGGRWISAEELAAEGLQRAVEELGL